MTPQISCDPNLGTGDLKCQFENTTTLKLCTANVLLCMHHRSRIQSINFSPILDNKDWFVIEKPRKDRLSLSSSARPFCIYPLLHRMHQVRANINFLLLSRCLQRPATVEQILVLMKNIPQSSVWAVTYLIIFPSMKLAEWFCSARPLGACSESPCDKKKSLNWQQTASNRSSCTSNNFYGRTRQSKLVSACGQYRALMDPTEGLLFWQRSTAPGLP